MDVPSILIDDVCVCVMATGEMIPKIVPFF